MAKKPKNNDTSNSDIVSIQDVAKEYQNQVINEQLDGLEKKNIDLANIIQQLQQENKHLKELLQGSALPIIGIASRITDEEIIAQTQLKRLLTVSNEREFTLEEAKKFDLLVKNKRLAQDKATGVIDIPKLPSDKFSLLQIAATKTPEENSND